MEAIIDPEDDPWHWPTDRVVRELCSPSTAWAPDLPLLPRPDPTQLEQSLRNEDVTGLTLLLYASEEVLIRDFGLKTFGKRAFVQHCISLLRLQSVKYQEHIRKNDASSVVSIRHESFGPSEQFRRGENFVLPDGKGQKRRKLSPDIEHDLVEYGQDHGHTETGGLETSTPDTAMPAELTRAAEGKKRKRLAPILITTEIDPNRNRDLPTEADTVVQNAPVDAQLPSTNEDVSTSHRSDKHSDLNNGLSSIKKLAGANEKRLANPAEKSLHPLKSSGDHAYLGKKKLRVDDIFYGNTHVGKDLTDVDETKEFQLASHKIPNGRRLYVHNVVKNFLRSEPYTFTQKGDLVTAVRPYAPKLAPKFQNPSLTLFYRSEGVIHARREQYDPLPPGDTDHVDGERLATFNPLGPGMIHGIGDGEGEWDESYLEKYKQLEGGDKVLPLYGDSDEENEYDLATWREIEEENGKLDRPRMPMRKPPLSVEEINEAITDGINDLVMSWKTKVLPKHEPKAWGIWRKSRAQNSKREQIIKAREELEQKARRITKMRNEIILDTWTSKAQVQRQTKIMEIDVFDREYLQWKISILELKKCPNKPLLPIAATRKEPPFQTNEEGESVESDVDIVSSDDDLNNFIDDDDELMNLAETERYELDLADSEPDSTDMLSDSPEPLANTPPKLKLVLKKSRSPNTSDHLEGSDSSDDASMPYVKAEGLNLPRTPNRGTAIIDLTLTSSDERPSTATRKFVDLVTPRKVSPLLKLVNRKSAFTSSPIVLSDPEEAQPNPQSLPAYDDVVGISGYSCMQWSEFKDRKRLLIRVVYLMDSESRKSIFGLLRDVSEEDLWNKGLLIVINGHLSKGDSSKGLSTKFHDALCYLTTMLHIFITCQYVIWRKMVCEDDLRALKSKKEEFRPFYQFAIKLEGYFTPKSTVSEPSRSISSKAGKNIVANLQADSEEDNEDEDLRPPVRRRRTLSTSEDDELLKEPMSPTPKKKKRKIFENAQARSLREADKLRLAVQEERRRKLQANLARIGQSQDEDPEHIIVNDAAGENQGHIYIDPAVASLIKKHQIEGLRFMWNQIVTVRDEDSMQGCLLAHTMGLGKSMQVITLLVSIAQASASSDHTISSQIPESLRISKTLILCPPTLVNNWMDELLIWDPKKRLGNLRTVAAYTKQIRLEEISEWGRDGGVLVLGYEMFRNLIHNKQNKNQASPPLTEEEHEEVLKNLLEAPNVIVADEAHKMKNAGAAITMATSKFRSKSRIALTGSPLANNVEEYHTMIEWVAPNYLGPIGEFRDKYAKPIQDGLYADSLPSQRRKALKMLGVLKEDLAPKVHRADMSVLRHDLPEKKEFVITIPLTEIQHKAYILYVRYVTGGVSMSDVAQTTLWNWFAILCLLCNHPYCFKEKLLEREEKKDKNGKKAATSIERASGAETPTAEEKRISEKFNPPGWKLNLPQGLVAAAIKLLEDEVNDLKSVELSNKVKIMCQILDESAKVNDKVLIFTQSIPTLDFLEELCAKQGRSYNRLDGKTVMAQRQAATKEFNEGATQIYLISTTAGGLGLNLYGANRVIIFDFKYNPISEEQAIGRSYRIGQTKQTFVYRFVMGGTFEESVHNKTIYKTQLASRVVDKKKPVAWATKKMSDFLFEPKEVPQQDLSGLKGRDPQVLDKILDTQSQFSTIRSIVESDTFEKDDDDKLTAEEEREVRHMIDDEALKRSNPRKWQEAKELRAAQDARRDAQLAGNHIRPQPTQSATQLQQGQTPQKSQQHLQPNQVTQVQQNQNSAHLQIPKVPQLGLVTNATKNNVRQMSPIIGANTKIKPVTPELQSPKSPTPEPHDSHGKTLGSSLSELSQTRSPNQKANDENIKQVCHDQTLSPSSTILSPKAADDSAVEVGQPQSTANAGPLPLLGIDYQEPGATPEVSKPGISRKFELCFTWELKNYLRSRGQHELGTRQELLDRCVAIENSDSLKSASTGQVEVADQEQSKQWPAAPESASSDGPPLGNSSFKNTFKKMFGFGIY